MRRILVLFAHPAIHKSVVNRRLISVYRDYPNVTFRDLYDIYPEFMVNVDVEQALLTTHELIIFHHPVYWYSCPPILKQWMDLVLKNGFAYGQGGDKLTGKLLMSTISTGQGERAYQPVGAHHHHLRHFLLPFEQTAVFCGMTYLPPFVAFSGGNRYDQVRLGRHLQQYRTVLTALSERQFDLSSINHLEMINADMSQFESSHKVAHA